MKKMKRHVFLTILVATMLFLGGFELNVFAAEGMPLGVRAVLPDNQFDKDVSYYSLMMKPGQKQALDFELVNTSDKEVTAIVELSNATTDDGGTISYNQEKKELDKSLLYPLTSIASTPKEVKIPAKETVTTKISLDMPAEEYSGMILGGINVTMKPEKEKKAKKTESSVKINNIMSYSIGILLLENEEFVKTDMKFERVFASQVSQTNTTKATLQNPTTAVMEDLTIEAKIFAKGSDKILYEVKKENMRMAPNSNFDFGIPVGSEPYKAGEYRLKLTATTDPKNAKDGERQTWDFDETFTIKREEADKLNKSSDLPPDYTLYYIIAGVVAVLLLTLLIVIIRRMRRKKQIAKQKAAAAKSRKGSRRKSSKSKNRKHK